MEQAITQVTLESAKDIMNKHGEFTIKELCIKLKKKLRSIWPVFGITESKMCALITVYPAEELSFTESLEKNHMCIEITRIYIDESYRKQGVMRDFIERIAIVAKSNKCVLIMGCVNGVRMHNIMKQNADKWIEYPKDTTSFMFIPTFIHNTS